MADGAALLDDLITRARRAGADAVDALLVESTELTLAQRLRAPEKVERSESRDLGLRVLIGRRQAVVSSTDLAADALDDLVARAVAMARAVPEDAHCGLADPDQICRTWPDLPLADPIEPSPDDLKARARACEDAALAVPGVTNSDGAEADWRRWSVHLAASNGFAGGYAVTSHGVGVSVLAGEGTAMERDYDFTNRAFAADLDDPAEIGRRAGERTVARLNPRRPATGAVPVVFHPRAANSLLRHLTGAINGTAVARGTSFLKDRMGEAVFAPGVTIIDDPCKPHGLRSRPFDGEGIGGQRRELIQDGRLTTWLLDLRSARQLGLETTGHASRGTTSPPSPGPTNVWLEPGSRTPEALMADITSGLYVTDLMGQGVNGVTGDYSRGCAGFWIENGRITHPVSEGTIAGNLKDMFAHLTPANDLEFRYGTDSPTVRIEGMTVAGGG